MARKIKSRRNISNGKKGISLIVLVITMIVIIILATAVIVTVVKLNPIEKASEAVFKSDFKELQSELEMYISNEFLAVKGDKTKFDITKLNLNETSTPKKITEVLTNLERSKLNGKVEVKSGKLVLKGTATENEKKWVKELTGEATPGDGNASDVTEPPTTVSTENVIYKDISSGSKTAVIPAGFRVSTKPEEQKIDTGLVILDSNENEFVWVPTDEVSYKKDFTLPCSYANPETINSDASLPNTIVSEIKQIQQYKGFYISRYEAGKDAGGILVSKKNVVAYNHINFDNAKAKAESMENTNKVKSGLVTGTMWDVVMNWIKISGVDINSDSSLWGNYGSTLAKTGINESWKVNNIYDLAGNLWEYTTELAGSTACVIRSGCYGNNLPASGRFADATERITGDSAGFRIVLYVI